MADDFYRCSECGEQQPEGARLDWVHNPLEPGHSIKLCERCAVRAWHCPIRFVWHVGIPKEVRERFETFDMLQRLQRWFRDDAEVFPVHLFHRREAETLQWQAKYDAHRSTRPTEPYGFRGFCSGLKIVILVDETETVDSLEWILYHELGHHLCHGRHAQMFDEAMDAENKTEGRGGYDWKDDAAHEADSEERLVNRIATAFMGGREYARPWWRPRVQALLCGAPELPDPFAVSHSSTSTEVAKEETPLDPALSPAEGPE